jgi:hypothetical protein
MDRPHRVVQGVVEGEPASVVQGGDGGDAGGVGEAADARRGVPVLIAALFVAKDGVYWGLPGVDPWDEARDARKYAGPWPVVAHPPCRRWSQMNKVNEARYGYKMGEDDGCFASALASLRAWGGVLEHPAESLAFPAFGLRRPVLGAWTKTFDGDWTTEVNQAAYGHRATKRTWLVYAGQAPPPALDWRRVRGTHQIGGFDVTLPQLPKAERAATPIPFRDLLLSIARSAVKGAHAA